MTDKSANIIEQLSIEVDMLRVALAEAQRREQDARNELCQKCGKYTEAHNGACDGCKWNGVKHG